MQIDSPSITALRVAVRRAAHQVLDHPRIFDDPLALRILGLEADTGHSRSWQDDTPLDRVLRTALAVRSRHAEEMLQKARLRGIDQYVVLGAGLDTFAYRHATAGSDGLRVFEVDHPATQEWKRQRLHLAGIAVPKHCIFVPVDFERQTLAEGLRLAGFDPTRPAFFSWLGVVMYLTADAIDATLRTVVPLPAGSGIVFDYMIDPELISPLARAALNGLAVRVAAAGEPLRSFFVPAHLVDHLRELGFGRIEDLSPEALDARYFHNRADGLRAGRLAHLMTAWV
ncbi:MAG: class I SAM-dependent methyltransferase [Desulfobulbus sp.]|jgi:methyltransferase (TIGR00027 family)|uniref:class I SAM-dependent methyltransferase n=1 Tax=Desulfobulbus sp. TaxID=895 RepID=UPI00284CE289|nr:class I SAM-dependent methyltransferase [Desulfobulbus sp.]MDR2551088.1 class I SAM-dependent methyltransferase [Desulfobulbus sp.]